jgi:transposase
LQKEDIIHEKEDVIRGKDHQITELEKVNDILKEALRLAKKYQYGRSSEKWTDNDKIHLLLFDEAELEADTPVSDEKEIITVPSDTKKSKKGRKPLSEDLPRKIITHELSDVERHCTKTDCPKYKECQKLRPIIGKDETEELEFIPAVIQVNHHIRYSYGPIECDDLNEGECLPTIITAPAVKRMIPGSIATPSLLSYVAVSKFSDALPFYRQERLFERIGVNISRQTMSNWIMNVSRKTENFIKLLREKSREGPLLNIDETTLQVLKEPGRPPDSTSYMWVVVGHHGENKIVLYNYYRRRTKQIANYLVEGFSGAIQTDGYAGYNEVGSRKDIWHVGCWAHARRKFHDAYKGSKKGGIAAEGLKYICKLYKIEKTLRKLQLSPEEFVSRRKKAVVPVLRKFKEWLTNQSSVVVPGSLLGKAISYALNEYKKLVRYLKYAYLTPDNNIAERAIRPFTVGRRNWLFNNSPRGAYASATMYSLIETAKANNLEPYHYLEFIFKRLPEADTTEKLEQLLPWNVSEIIPPLKVIRV